MAKNKETKLGIYKDDKLTKMLGDEPLKFSRPMTGEEDLEEVVYVHNPTNYDFTVSDMVLPSNVESDMKKDDLIGAHDVRKVVLRWKANNEDKPMQGELLIRGYYVMYPQNW